MFTNLENKLSSPTSASAPTPNLPPENTAPPQSPPQDTSPLDNLRDIHLPENIDQFPSAIGWWILLGILICTLGFIIFRAIKKHRALRYLRTAKLELNLLSQQRANNVSLSQLSALLKRISLIYYPSNTVASLSGDAWWDFMNNETGQQIYSEDDIKQMSQSRYQKDSSIDKVKYAKLIKKTEKCIDLIVRKSIKNKMQNNAVAKNDSFLNGVAQ